MTDLTTEKEKREMKSTYFRWSEVSGGSLRADILGTETDIRMFEAESGIYAKIPDRLLSPDEARMIGVRLIEAATRAEGSDSVRRQ